jgi:hypothetical protein
MYWAPFGKHEKGRSSLLKQISREELWKQEFQGLHEHTHGYSMTKYN